MTKWKLILLSIMFLVLINIVVADRGLIEIYKPNEVFDLSLHLTNDTGEVLGASCKVQIRNVSLNVTLNDDMNEIGGGWYNYTHNTSKVGKYFCRQNCTKGSLYVAETCDFVIEADEKMAIAIAIIIIGTIAMFFVFGLILDKKQHPALKLIFLFGALFMVLLGLNYASQVAIESGASSGIKSMINTTYKVGLYVTIIFVAYWLLYYTFTIFMHFKQYGK